MCYFVIMKPKNEKVKTLNRLISVPRLRLPSLSRGSPGAGAAAAGSRLPRDGRRRHWLVSPLGGALPPPPLVRGSLGRALLHLHHGAIFAAASP